MRFRGDFASDGAIPNNFFASFAGDTLFSASHIAKQGWTEYIFDVTASSSSSVLTFSSMDTPGYLGLDNVSVDPVPTPEPCSLLLIGFGLAGLMVLNRKLRAARMVAGRHNRAVNLNQPRYGIQHRIIPK